MIDLQEYLKLAVALIAIVDIPGNVPLFLQQTQGMSAAQKRVAAVSAGVATAAILFVFAFAGDVVLEAFGITIDAFKVVGGLVILLIALDMLGLITAGALTMEAEEGAHPVAIGIFPLAVPLFAGPGAISAVMVYAHEEFHSDHDLIVGLLILSVAVAIVAGMTGAAVVSHLIGPLTQSVINRLLGMIVGALGVEFILEGVAGFLAAPGPG